MFQKLAHPLKPAWVAWRQGYLGVWSLAHLTTIGAHTLCGEPIPVDHHRAGKYMMKCSKCQDVRKRMAAEQTGGGDAPAG